MAVSRLIAKGLVLFNIVTGAIAFQNYASFATSREASPIRFQKLAPLASTISPFEFVSADRIVFGSGTADQIPDLVKYTGAKKVLFVTGKTGLERYSDLIDKIEKKVSENGSTSGSAVLPMQSASIVPFIVSGEPSVDDILQGKAVGAKNDVDCVVAVGGGSCIDAAKAIAAVLTNHDDIYTYLEVVGKGQPIQNQPLPLIVAPTTSGTGSEVTKNSVIAAGNVKVSMRNPMMLPDVAVVDPLLTVGCPPEVTACTGMDALCQCVEPYLSRMANPVTDALCLEGIMRASSSLQIAVEDGSNIEARENMAIASLIGGLALANAKLGAAHGFAGTLGGMYKEAPHGAVCAALLPHCFRANARALKHLAAAGDVSALLLLERHTLVARLLTGDDAATPEDGASWLEDMSSKLKIPKLSSFGLKEEDFAAIAAQSAKSSSMKGNPVDLPQEALIEILAKVC